MSLKDISYLELWQLICLEEQNHLCNLCIRHCREQVCEIILNLDQWFRRCPLKIFLIELWQPFCSVELNHLCNFGKGHYEKQFCEMILNLEQWFRRKCH